MVEEYWFTCPYCWQRISTLIDLSVSSQTIIEDCEVCCKPIEITYKVAHEQIVDFSSNSMQE